MRPPKVSAARSCRSHAPALLLLALLATALPAEAQQRTVAAGEESRPLEPLVLQTGVPRRPITLPLQLGAALRAALATPFPDWRRHRWETAMAAAAPAAAPADTTEELTLALDARLESKAIRSRDETCSPNPLFNLPSTCRSFFQPNFDFQFSVRSGGTVADRVNVDVDYDSQREFDASNRIALQYQGREGALLERLEVGNVTFLPPPSRFLTGTVPMGNYGVQAMGRVGPWSVQTIAAQQRGNVVQERRFTVGGQTLQGVERELADYELEPRRFFFTVDPTEFGALYPNLDILDAQQLETARRALSPERRPVRVFVYRQVIGGRPPNPNGPRFRLNGDPTSRRGIAYELLRENVDYYMDPSRLWLALVRPLSLHDERLVVAFTVSAGDGEAVNPATGGTPDVEFQERDQVANLVWEPRLEPDDPAFRREIRSVYRVGGPDVQRQSVEVRVVSGAAGDQEKPLDGVGDSYLQRFGLAQRTNSSEFDVENRLWPRPADPNVVIGGGEVAPIVRDRFLVFPSLEPFARRGLAGAAGNPVNDTLYRTPGEYLYSAQHPAPAYRIAVRYLTDAGGAGTIVLGSVQLRQGSERVTMDGRTLRRGLDYEMDYDLGRLRLLRPESVLGGDPREVRVRFEENPLFVSTPTSLFGLTSQIEFDDGVLALTAIAQRQKTVFNRPPLGFEGFASLMAGVSGSFGWDAPALTRLVDRLPGVRATGASRVTVSGEFATSRPLSAGNAEAYLESFEGEGGLAPALTEGRWYFGSRPAPSPALDATVGGIFTLERAATMAWQNVGRSTTGDLVTFSIEQIDPEIRSVGGGAFLPEQILWLTMHPLAVGGFFRDGRLDQPRWRVAGAPTGRRWRSVHTALGPTGVDLTRAEAIEFWTLVDLDPGRRDENPVLVIDLGEVSENSVTFVPDTLRIAPGVEGLDSLYRGKRLAGIDTLNSELDPFSRTFNQARNDVGLPGDVAPSLFVVEGGTVRDTTDVRLCVRGQEQVLRLGDTRANCTVGNNRADTQDLDGDDVLNLDRASLGAERIRRYVVNLADDTHRARVGRCNVQLEPPVGGVPSRPRCWVQYRVAFRSPNDSLNGGPPLRRVQSLRVTMISGAMTADGARIVQPLARLRLTGAPWLKRSERSVQGIAGERPGQGTVIATVIGTQDRDSTRGLFYESPPGVLDEPEQRQTGLEANRLQVNERSLRLQALDLQPFERAEAYVRFPEGQKSFLGYRELRLWARGRNSGWGQNGELQFFVKIGRDADNFYMYRAPANAGTTRSAWEPEVRVDLRRFGQLRGILQRLFLEQPGGAIACTGTDSALVASTPPSPGATGPRYAVCQEGYIAYSVNPAVNPPNLAAVNELAVGMVRLGSNGPLTSAIVPGDTLELWVNDLRLGSLESTPGYAGLVALTIAASDVAEFTVGMVRRDPYFRQLTETPGFRTDDAIDAAATVHVDRFLPERLNVRLPITVRHSFTNVEPLYVSGADYEGAAIPGMRTPRAHATTVTASVRAAQPLDDSPWGMFVNGLTFTASVTDASTRSEYQSGRAGAASAQIGYTAIAAPRTVLMPRWFTGAVGALPGWLQRALGVGAVDSAEFRWNPAEVRVTTGLSHGTERRETFLRPAPTADDVPREVSGESHIWRTGGSIGFEPLSGVSARVELTSLRDLRDYGDTSVAGLAVSRARHSLLGSDVGFERERMMGASVRIAPTATDWLQPRLELRARYDLLRDPNRDPVLAPLPGDTLLAAQSVLHALGAGGAAAAVDEPFDPIELLAQNPHALDPVTGLPLANRLAVPRRLGNERMLGTGAQVDVSRALFAGADSASLGGWLLRHLRPLDVSYTRTLRSAYDGLPFSPGIGYQVGWGSAGDFRQLRGTPASTAGLGTQLVLTQTLALPGGLALTGRFTRNRARNWTRQPLIGDDDSQRADEGAQRAFPDLTARWGWRAPDAVGGAGDWIVEAGASARLLHTLQRNVALADAPDLRETRTALVRSYPVNGSITWAFGRLTTGGGYALTLRTDTIPGTLINSVTRDASAEIGRPWTLPAQWGLHSDLRTRASYQYSHSESRVRSLADVLRASRLFDQGRWLASLNAEADVAENLTFALQGSRSVTFDENLGRRFAQTIFSAALQLSFFGGVF